MKYLSAYLKICERYCEDECNECPFSVESTGMVSCHQWILHNKDEAKALIEAYVKKAKEDKQEKYVAKCQNCHNEVMVHASAFTWDNLLDCYAFDCPCCGAYNEALELRELNE